MFVIDQADAGVAKSDGGDDPSADPNANGCMGEDSRSVPYWCSGTNPDGVPYPRKNIGFRARQGATPGLVIPNIGFVVGTKPQETTAHEVQLADVFDPDGKSHDIVAILGVTFWGSDSRRLMASFDGAAPPRVVVLSVLGEGEVQNVPPKFEQIVEWRTMYPWAWNVVQSEFTSLMSLFEKPAVPFVCVLDARTMEIVYAMTGVPADVRQDIINTRQIVTSRPPAY